MKAIEKFEERAKELGIDNELQDYPCSGVKSGDEIIVLVNEDGLRFKELHFDTFETMIDKINDFKNICMMHWLFHNDSCFFQRLCMWLYSTGKCPLNPVDVLCLSEIHPNKTIVFEDDDVDVEKIIRSMTLDELIKFFNKCFTCPGTFNFINDMDNDVAWKMFEEQASGNIKYYLFNSSSTFSVEDDYFFWDKECMQLISFSTADELRDVFKMEYLVDRYKRLQK